MPPLPRSFEAFALATQQWEPDQLQSRLGIDAEIMQHEASKAATEDMVLPLFRDMIRACQAVVALNTAAEEQERMDAVRRAVAAGDTLFACLPDITAMPKRLQRKVKAVVAGWKLLSSVLNKALNPSDAGLNQVVSQLGCDATLLQVVLDLPTITPFRRLLAYDMLFTDHAVFPKSDRSHILTVCEALLSTSKDVLRSVSSDIYACTPDELSRCKAQWTLEQRCLFDIVKACDQLSYENLAFMQLAAQEKHGTLELLLRAYTFLRQCEVNHLKPVRVARWAQ